MSSASPDKDLFAHVDDVVRSVLDPDLASAASTSWHRYGIKVWFPSPDERARPEAKPTRVHYEAQVVQRRHFDGGKGFVFEIGLHAEHKDEADNQAVLDGLFAVEMAWRPQLGDEATGGAFLGADHWRRLSDVWLDPELDEPDVDFEIGGRLADFIEALQPLLPTA